MNSSAPNRLRRAGWVTMTVLATAIALVSARYFTLDPDTFLPEQRAVYLANLAPLLLHVGGAVPALLLGPWQFSQRLRTRRPALHRVVGRIYLSAVLAAGVGGLLLAPKGLVGPIAPLGFAALALLLLLTTTAAYLAVRRREFARHQVWMVRSYALVFTAVTFRLWIGLLPAVGVPFDQAYASGAWSAWLINLLVTERVIASTRTRRTGPQPEGSVPTA